MLKYVSIANLGVLAVSVASLVCLACVFVSCDSTSSTSTDLYFMEMNVSGIANKLESILVKRSPTPSLLGSVSSAVGSASDAAESVAGAAEGAVNTVESDLKEFENDSPDFYLIGLRSYCTGMYDNGNRHVTNCSSPEISFTFNLTESLHLPNGWVAALFPASVDKGLSLFSQLSHWIVAGYLLAVVLISLEIVLIGLGELVPLHRLLGGIISTGASIFFLSSSVSATVLYVTMAKILDAVGDTCGITARVGYRLLVTTWLGCAFALLGTIIIFIAECCPCYGMLGII